MSFIPEGYQEPTSSGGRYTKIEEGKKVKLRILASPIQGYEKWTVEPKPVRWRTDEQEPQRGDWKPNEQSKLFWAMPVFNYTSEQIEIWQVGQKTIRQELAALAQNEDWGSPTEYDLTVGRTGSGLETKYQVHPSPHRQVEEMIMTMFAKMKPNLNALFSGDDPFA